MVSKLINNLASLSWQYCFKHDQYIDKLHNRKIRLEFTDLNTSFTLHFFKDKLVLTDEQPDISVSGSVASFIKLKTDKSANNMNFSGDLEILEDLNKLLENIDIEHILSYFLGDKMAYFSSKLSNKLLSRLVKTRDQLSFSLTEFLLYDQKLFANKTEFKNFSQDVDKLYYSADKLISQINRSNDGTTENQR